MQIKNKNILIIGGGLGGLVCGCLLCKEGYKITILEQHVRVGGGLHCFSRYGVNFETGIHYISGFQENGVLRKIFKYIGIFEQLNIKFLDVDGFDLLHIGTDNKKYYFGRGRDNFVKILSKQFPDEENNIKNYIDSIYDISNKIPLNNLDVDFLKSYYFDKNFILPVGEYIDSFTQNKKLRSVLSWTNMLYGGEKETTPAYIHALITKFFIEGASRFVNGSQQLANAMQNFIEANGGKVYCSTKVNEINIENKSIKSIFANKNEEFNADLFISDIHPSVLLDMIDPNKIQRSYRERLQSIENSYSTFTVYIVFKKKSFPHFNYNYYYYDDYDSLWQTSDYNHNTFPKGFMLSTSFDNNNLEFAEKAIINCVMNYEDVKKWENTYTGKRGKDYNLFKKENEAKVLTIVEKVFPDFMHCIDKVFSSSPLTIRDYLGTKNGSLYGYKKDCKNMSKSQVPAKTKIENLLLTGQNINLHGILGVPISSIITVGEIVGLAELLNKINNQ